MGGGGGDHMDVPQENHITSLQHNPSLRDPPSLKPNGPKRRADDWLR